MYQKDYILRMIERIGILVSGILGLIKKGDLREAGETLDLAYQEVLKEDAAFFNSIPISRLTEELIQKHNYTHGHLDILAQLFYAQAELFYARGEQKNSLEYYQKSQKLLEFIIEESRSYSVDKQSRLTEIKKRISDAKS